MLVLTLLMALGAARRIVPEGRIRLACNRSAPESSRSCWPAYDRELLTLAGWVRDSTPPDAVFMVSKERAFFVHSGRKSINQDRALREDSTTVGDYLRARGVSYTIISPVGVLANRHARLVTSACREFELVRQVSHRTMLFRVLPQATTSDSTAACEAARSYVPTRRGDG